MTLILSGTAGLSDVDGSAATPAIRGTDTNTGIFFPAADTVGITTGGTERARVDSSGNMGLGVTPSAWNSARKVIQVGAGSSLVASTTGASFTEVGANTYLNSGAADTYIGSDYASKYRQANGAHVFYTAASGTAGNAITFTQAMTLDASGNLGVGTTSPANRLDVAGSGVVVKVNSTNSNDQKLEWRNNGTLVGTIGASSTALVLFADSSYTERARINSDGHFLVGTTTTSQSSGVGAKILSSGNLWLVCSSADPISYYSSTAGAYRFYVGPSGAIASTSSTISVISDQRFKENVRDLNDGLEKVMALQPRLYDWKEGKGQDIKNARGFIAQEFEQVFPDMIDEWKDPAPEGEEPYKSVRADLIPVLVKAIQEQQALIAQLQADVAALKGNA